MLLVLAVAALLALPLLRSPAPLPAPDEQPVPGAAGGYVEGTHWHRIELPADSRRRAGGRIPVVYVFNYAARDALALEPRLRAWVAALPADVEFSRLVATGNATWRRHARNYLALDQVVASGAVADDIHLRMLELVARRPQAVLTPAGVTRELLSGPAADRFRAAFDAPQTLQQLAQAQQLLARWQLPGVPAVVIDNRLVVVVGEVGVGQALQVADYLLDRVREQDRRASGGA